MERFFVQPIPAWKRLLDIVGSSAALLVFSPVILAIAALIKLTSSGPVIFRQQREGLGGVPFTIYKFRTMCVDADSRKAELRARSEQDGPAFKLKQDPRCTPFGRFLRKTSLDELPQLFNVLKGDLSLVGPRPLPIDESLACERWQRRRLTVTPGITCIWQTEGRSSVPFTVWMRMDLQYSRERSFWRDMAILFRTIPAVLRGDGAH
jgi:lipopolysaccharide/colanic/teichoic acid biosynthesis glycosyltransferase